MTSFLHLLSADQLELIVSTYGSVSDWFSQYADVVSITIEDIML